jgi:glutathionyl-hydroquinone reductase
LLATRSEAKPTEEAAEAATAKRLEDVEKVVREIERGFAEQQEYVEEVFDNLMTRLEALESRLGPRAVVEVFLDGPSLD